MTDVIIHPARIREYLEWLKDPSGAYFAIEIWASDGCTVLKLPALAEVANAVHR